MESTKYLWEVSVVKKQNSSKWFKRIALIFVGITGFFASGLGGGILMTLADGIYQMLIQLNDVIGLICAAFALITIGITLIFKNNDWVFMIFSFITATLGLLQFTILATSQWSTQVFWHYQYVVTLVTSIISIVFVFIYLNSTRRKNIYMKVNN